MTLHFTFHRLELGWLCISVLACVQLSMNAEIPSGGEKVPVTSSTAVQTQPTSTITNFLFRIEGTPLLSRVQELTGIVFQEDLDPQPIKRSRGIEILPRVEPPSSTDAAVSGQAFVPHSFHNAGSGIVFLPRPAIPGSLELLLLLKLKGVSMKPNQLFMNLRDGHLILSGTTKDAEVMREVIQNPPTNAVAYLRSITNGLDYNERK